MRGRAAGPVDRVEAGDADDPLVLENRELHAAVLLLLAAGGADERERVDDAAGLADERHPVREVGAVGVDQREQLLRIRVLEAAQRAAFPQIDFQRHTLSLAQRASAAPRRRPARAGARIAPHVRHLRPRRLPGPRLRRGSRRGAARASGCRSRGSPTSSSSRSAPTFLGEGSGTLELFSFTDPEILEPRLDGAERRLDHVAFRVDDIEAVAATLRAAGARFCGPDRREEVFEPIPTGPARALWSLPRDDDGPRDPAHPAAARGSEQQAAAARGSRSPRSRRRRAAQRSVRRVKKRTWSERGSKWRSKARARSASRSRSRRRGRAWSRSAGRRARARARPPRAGRARPGRARAPRPSQAASKRGVRERQLASCPQHERHPRRRARARARARLGATSSPVTAKPASARAVAEPARAAADVEHPRARLERREQEVAGGARSAPARRPAARSRGARSSPRVGRKSIPAPPTSDVQWRRTRSGGGRRQADGDGGMRVSYDSRAKADPRGIGRYVRCMLEALRETAAPGQRDHRDAPPTAQRRLPLALARRRRAALPLRDGRDAPRPDQPQAPRRVPAHRRALPAALPRGRSGPSA